MDNASASGALTQLLERHRAGDEQALSQATALAYVELKRLAERHLRRDGRSTLAATDVLHEACLRLLGERVSVSDRSHFFALASRIMRNILVDYARSRQRLKRGAGEQAVTMTTGIEDPRTPDVEVLALDEALSKLAELDPRKCQVLEMHYFGGLTYDEMAEATGTSAATVDRDLRFAKAWLERELVA